MPCGVDICFHKASCKLSDMEGNVMELSYVILSYFYRVQNFLEIEGKLKIVIY